MFMNKKGKQLMITRYMVLATSDTNFILEIEAKSEKSIETKVREVIAQIPILKFESIRILDEVSMKIWNKRRLSERQKIDFDPINEDYWNPDTTPAEDFDLKDRIEEVEKESQEPQKKSEKGSD
jgi:hypothetical protein